MRYPDLETLVWTVHPYYGTNTRPQLRIYKTWDSFLVIFPIRSMVKDIALEEFPYVNSYVGQVTMDHSYYE